MNVTSNQVIKIIYDSFDELNEQLPPESWLKKAPETRVSSRDGGLDSMGFVTFISLLEEKCEAAFGVTLSLADSAGDTTNPFETAGQLAAYLEGLLAKQ